MHKSMEFTQIKIVYLLQFQVSKNKYYFIVY